MSRRRLIAWTAAGLSLAGLAALGFFALEALRGVPVYADASDPELVRRGERIYAAECAACHGARLEGQPNWRERLPDGTLPAPPHDAEGHTWHHPDQVLFDYTRDGGQAMAPPGFRSAMPAFGQTLEERDILAALAYIKSRWPAEVRDRQERINDAYRRQWR